MSAESGDGEGGAARPLAEVAAPLGLGAEDLEPRGDHLAKLRAPTLAGSSPPPVLCCALLLEKSSFDQHRFRCALLVRSTRNG